MKRKPQLDYREFRLNKINEPQFRHLKLLLGWVGYFILYALTERFIPAESCTPVHCALDDIIPFCEYFAVFYILWYLLVAGSLLYFLLYDVESFKRLMKFIIITQITAMAAYILFPTRQDLRPEVFPRDNFFTDCMSFIYSFDTSTNVCPSLHVAYSIGIASCFVKSEAASRPLKLGVCLFSLMVCLSTAFVKQHSVLDGLAALPVCLMAEVIVFRDYYKNKISMKKHRSR